MFKKSGQTGVEVLDICLPEVYITSDALSKMKLYTNNCDEEVGWLGTAIQSNEKIIIEDTMLFNQEVNGTTTEITPEGLAIFAEELLKEENGCDLWNKIKVWGHSHTNMGTSPSGQDDSQMETFENSKHDWFIRIITNKKDELRVDLFSFNQGITYNNLEWKEIISKEEKEIQDKIKELEEKLNNMQEERTKKYEDVIKKEINQKVTKKQHIKNKHINQNRPTPGLAPHINTTHQKKNTSEYNNHINSLFLEEDEADFLLEYNNWYDMLEILSENEIFEIGFQNYHYAQFLIQESFTELYLEDIHMQHIYQLCNEYANQAYYYNNY